MVAHGLRETTESWTMTTLVWRAHQIYSRPAQPEQPAKPGKPAKPAQPAKPGILPIGKTHFFEKIAPQLEKVRLGENVDCYTDRSLRKLIEAGIAAAKENV
jgi:hypothetical protein